MFFMRLLSVCIFFIVITHVEVAKAEDIKPKIDEKTAHRLVVEAESGNTKYIGDFYYDGDDLDKDEPFLAMKELPLKQKVSSEAMLLTSGRETFGIFGNVK